MVSYVDISALTDEAGLDSEGSTNVGNGLLGRRGPGELKTCLFLEAGSFWVKEDDGVPGVLSSSQLAIQSKVLFSTAFLWGGEGDDDDRMSVARPREMPSLRLW